MTEISELLRGIASLLWPLTVTISVFLFREDIKGLLSRLKRAKVLGQEVELLDHQLDELEETAQRLDETAGSTVTELSIEPSASSSGDSVSDLPEAEAVTSGGDSALDAIIRSVLNEAARSPKVGLLLLSNEIESATRELTRALGIGARSGRRSEGMNSQSLTRMMGKLHQTGSLATETYEAVKKFQLVRNEVVHNAKEISDASVLRAIDSGIAILRAFRTFANSLFVVVRNGITVYSDAEGLHERSDFEAVELESLMHQGRRRTVPTRPRAYELGAVVSWNNDSFSFDAVCDESWVRRTPDGPVEPAWLGAACLVGKIVWAVPDD